MTLDELLKALADNPGSILAWEADQPRDLGLAVFKVDGGTSEIAHMSVSASDHLSIAATLEARRIDTGTYGTGTGLVWRRSGRTFSVWGPKGRVFHTDGKNIELARRSVVFQPSMKVVAYIDEDLVARGVRLEGGDEPVPVATHLQLRATMDPSYGPFDAMADCGWTVYLGRALADMLGVPLDDRTG